jgi:SHS2 domain-containing protein
VWRWVEHTGELELEIEAGSAEGVFADAAAALADLLAGDDAVESGASARTLAVEAPDRPALLAAFVDELVFIAESESVVPVGLRRVDLGNGRARATVEVAPGDPPHLVKAVTYHRLEFSPAARGYRARVVLDV